MTSQIRKSTTTSFSTSGGGGGSGLRTGSLRIGGVIGTGSSMRGSGGGGSVRSSGIRSISGGGGSGFGSFRSGSSGGSFSLKRSSGFGSGSSSGFMRGGGMHQRKAMSLYSSNSPRQMSLAGGMGQQSNFDLEAPIPVNDTTQQVVRVNETKQISTLNNQFVSLISSVRILEERNTKLTIQLNLMQQQGSFASNIDNMFQAYIENLKKQLEALGQEKLKFESELVQMQGLVEDFKNKYEDEINKRTEMENEFVMVKKDVDESYMNKVELEAKLESLIDEIEFLKAIFQAEIDELQTQVQNTCVNVQITAPAQINMQAMIEEIQQQYQQIAEANRKESQSWKEMKMQELSMSTGGGGDEIRVIKAECTDLMNRIRRLTTDIENLKRQRAALEAACTEAEERGELSLKDSKLRIQQLQEAIQKAKNELTLRAREMEELLSVKLALDIEIATYRKLLEGEEQRLVDGIQTISIQQSSQSASAGAFGAKSSEIGQFLTGMESSSLAGGLSYGGGQSYSGGHSFSSGQSFGGGQSFSVGQVTQRQTTT